MINAKKAKKGFTIVELVIVIAVIAILAAVLIPTFTTVVKNAKESAALSEAKTTYTEYLSETLADSDNETDVLIKSGDYYFTVTNGQLDTKPATNPDTATYTEVVYASAKATDGTWDTKANVFIYAKPTTTGGGVTAGNG